MSNPPQVIAIVDDDAAVREALFDFLQVEGLAARTFDGAAALLADASAEDFGCVITDVQMPDIDGLRLQQRLRMLPRSIPVIFVTSSRDEALRARALREGAVAWFTKPVADDVLLEALRTALAGRR